MVGTQGIEPYGCLHGGSTAHPVSIAVYVPGKFISSVHPMVVPRMGFEPTELGFSNRGVYQLRHLGELPGAGFEPATLGF